MAKEEISGYGELIKGNQWVRVHGPNLKDTSVQEASNKARKNDPQFVRSCSEAGVEATTRQASKWNNSKGKAYKTFKNIYMNGISEIVSSN